MPISFKAPVRRLAMLLILAVPAMGLVPIGSTGQRIVVIGTGPVAGLFFPAGGAICNLVDRERARHGLRCLVESTSGSGENIEKLRAGEVDFAIVQSDWQYRAATDGARGEEEEGGDLRAVLSLYALPVTVVTRPDAEIARLEDLKGRRIGIGLAGSAIESVAQSLFDAMGWSRDDFEEVSDLDVPGQIAALCAGRIDAFILAAAHPSPAVAQAMHACDATLVDVTGPAVDRMIADWPFFTPATIPMSLYGDGASGRAVRTYGPRATVVTMAAVPDEIVYEFVRAVLVNIEDLGRQHQAFGGLSAQAMKEAGNSAAFHEGALKYFGEVGLQ